MQVLSTGNPHAFAYVRGKAPWQVVVVTNFTEQEQSIGAEHVTDFGLGAIGIDLVRAEVCGLDKALVLEPYHVLWLMALPPGQARH
jgi:hypothetical protein